MEILTGILSLGADVWTAVAAIATALGVAVALLQIRSVRFQFRKARTLEACGAYDLNENIYAALNVLWVAKQDGSLESDTKKYRPQVNLILNHLDSIAIGIEQDLYIESLAFDHLSGIVQRHVRTYMDSGLIEKAEIDRSSYVHLIDLRDRWQRARPRFRDSFTWRFWQK